MEEPCRHPHSHLDGAHTLSGAHTVMPLNCLRNHKFSNKGGEKFSISGFQVWLGERIWSKDWWWKLRTVRKHIQWPCWLHLLPHCSHAGKTGHRPVDSPWGPQHEQGTQRTLPLVTYSDMVITEESCHIRTSYPDGKGVCTVKLRGWLLNFPVNVNTIHYPIRWI